jgi:hypothetical protein
VRAGAQGMNHALPQRRASGREASTLTLVRSACPSRLDISPQACPPNQ